MIQLTRRAIFVMQKRLVWCIWGDHIICISNGSDNIASLKIVLEENSWVKSSSINNSSYIDCLTMKETFLMKEKQLFQF
uniref:Uncharacterized protein n=1 Tax=Onchocerca volvulus TaxID=6282 RepID=A0A8R1TJR8_ONCVO